jgi:hypothetical protein
MNECAKKCFLAKTVCKQKECRLWMNHKADLNCALIATKLHPGPMTLSEISKRLNLSIVRIKQIQDRALQKLKKNAPLLK